MTTITGPVLDRQGDPMANATLVWRPASGTFEGDSGNAYAPDGITIVTDGSGDFSEDFAPGDYIVTAFDATPAGAPLTDRIIQFRAGVPSAGTHALGDIIGQVADVDSSILAQAQAAAAQAAAFPFVGTDTVAELLADTTFSYTAAVGKVVVAPGDIVIVREGPFPYRVVASDAAHDVATADGVRFEVVRGADGSIHARAFGAVGDGVADDTDPLQSAINKGGLVKIGRHFVTAGITVGTGTTIEGADPVSSEIFLDASINAVVLNTSGSGLEDVTLRNFTISGNYEETAPTLTFHGVRMNDVTRLTIENVNIRATKEFGALIRRCNNVVVSGCRVENSGIKRDGFKFLACNGVTFTGNVLRTGDDCVSVSGEDIASENVTICGNDMQSDYASAVRINTTETFPSPVRNVAVTGNTISYTDSIAVFLQVFTGEAQIEDITISGNVIKNFGKSDNNATGSAYGVRVLGSALNPIRRVVISSNVFVLDDVPTTKVAYGVFAAHAREILVSDNSINFSQTLGADSAGVLMGAVNAPVLDFNVSGNLININGNCQYGVHILRSQRGLVSSNVIVSPSLIGIRGAGDSTTSCDFISVKGNKIYDPLSVPVMERGIRSEGTSNNWIIEENEIRNNSTAAIAVVGANNAIRRNFGFVTENSGSATVAAGNVEATVGHGLALAPAQGDIMVTATNDLGTATRFWVSNITAGSFKINVDAAPGGSGATFAWQVIRKS